MQERKSEVRSGNFSDDDLIQMFIKDKFKDVTSPRLRLKQNRARGLELYFRQFTSREFEKFAEIARVESQVNGKRKMLIINPKLGTELFIRQVMGAFKSNERYWVYQLTPLTVDQALEIHRGGTDESRTVTDSQAND